MSDVVRMESQHGDVRVRIPCKHLSSNTGCRIDHSGDLVAFGSLDHMSVRDDDATQSIGKESGAVRKTSLNPEHAVTQALEKRRSRIHSTRSGARDGKRWCTLYGGVVVRQGDG
jgi:hypothetical protein